MKKSVLIRAALLCLLAVPAAGQVPAGPQEKMPLDGEVRVGRLDNGMTYYIRHYDNPRQRADFFIAHDVGALQEEDDQNGLAHFLEHMAFNGTKHFPGKGILNYLAANGVRFGYNVNAYTSRDRTVYNVSNVPLVREGLVDSLLLILHDWSYYIACEPGEIESERGVIREEWRRGNDARSRMARKSAGRSGALGRSIAGRLLPRRQRPAGLAGQLHRSPEPSLCHPMEREDTARFVYGLGLLWSSCGQLLRLAWKQASRRRTWQRPMGEPKAAKRKIPG